MTIIPKQAMVLAAGLGKRMRPLTDHIPKPMIEVANRTLVDRAIDQLEQAGVANIVVNSSYKAEVLEDHLSRRKSPHLLFSREAAPLETGGGIAHALHHFGNSAFFVVNGDIIWTNGRVPALKRLAASWNEDLDALLLLHPTQTAIGYDGIGDFFIDQDDHIIRRKPEEQAPFVYAGVQIVHPRLFVDAPKGAFSLNILYDKAIRDGRIKALKHDGAWLHVGDPAGRDKAEAYLLASGN
jgi:MurNAc alpha-1-phosphate uridylyltransferase